jgi:hypothetical protein
MFILDMVPEINAVTELMERWYTLPTLIKEAPRIAAMTGVQPHTILRIWVPAFPLCLME